MRRKRIEWDRYLSTRAAPWGTRPLVWRFLGTRPVFIRQQIESVRKETRRGKNALPAKKQTREWQQRVERKRQLIGFALMVTTRRVLSRTIHTEIAFFFYSRSSAVT